MFIRSRADACPACSCILWRSGEGVLEGGEVGEVYVAVEVEVGEAAAHGQVDAGAAAYHALLEVKGIVQVDKPVPHLVAGPRWKVDKPSLPFPVGVVTAATKAQAIGGDGHVPHEEPFTQVDTPLIEEVPDIAHAVLYVPDKTHAADVSADMAAAHNDRPVGGNAARVALVHSPWKVAERNHPVFGGPAKSLARGIRFG